MVGMGLVCFANSNENKWIDSKSSLVCNLTGRDSFAWRFETDVEVVLRDHRVTVAVGDVPVAN